MQYWIRKSLVLGVITALSGCSVFINNAHDEKNYRVSEQFKVPADLQKPYQDPEYVMTPAQYSKAMPSDIVKPPAQVLNVAIGSWVEEGDKQTRIFFDKSDGIDDLKGFMWTTLNDLLDENKYGFGNLGLAYTFYHAAPDNCLNILWDNKNGWYPLIKK